MTSYSIWIKVIFFFAVTLAASTELSCAREFPHRICRVNDYLRMLNNPFDQSLAIQMAIDDCINHSNSPRSKNIVQFEAQTYHLKLQKYFSKNTNLDGSEGNQDVYRLPGIIISGRDLLIQGKKGTKIYVEYNMSLNPSLPDAITILGRMPKGVGDKNPKTGKPIEERYVYPDVTSRYSVLQGEADENWGCRVDPITKKEQWPCFTVWKGGYRAAENIEIRDLEIKTVSANQYSNCIGVIGVDNVKIENVTCLKAKQTSLAIIAWKFRNYYANSQNVYVKNFRSLYSGRHGVRLNAWTDDPTLRAPMNINAVLDNLEVRHIQLVESGDPNNGAYNRKIAVKITGHSRKTDRNSGVTFINPIFDKTGQIFARRNFDVKLTGNIVNGMYQSQIHGGLDFETGQDVVQRRNGNFYSQIAVGKFEITNTFIACKNHHFQRPYRRWDGTSVTASMRFAGFRNAHDKNPSLWLGDGNRYYKANYRCFIPEELTENDIATR